MRGSKRFRELAIELVGGGFSEEKDLLTIFWELGYLG